MNRREFIYLSSAGIASTWAGLPLISLGQSTTGMSRTDDVNLEIAGVTEPFQFIHLTDAHLTECDERNEKLIEYLNKRSLDFGGNPLAKAKAVVRASMDLKPEFIAFTGDLMDVPTAANFEAAAAMLATINVPCWFSLGNHEWQKPAEPPSSQYWRKQIKSFINQPLDFFAREFNGVNLIFLDNSDYQITGDQLKRTAAVLATGRPCILFMHIPISIDALRPEVMQDWNNLLLMGCEDGIFPPTENTRSFCALIKSRTEIAAIFAGHLHINRADSYGGTRMQYVGYPVFAGGLRKVSVRPPS